MPKKVTVIISDLHLGGGSNDRGDDHIYQGTPLVRLLDELGKSDHGKKGEIELLINGDLFEFAQVKPELYAGGNYETWSSEVESLERLNIVLDGHADIFKAIKDFQKPDNIVAMAAGNHDVDICWPKVQARIREVAGNVQFITGEDWYFRHGGRLHISHGHMEDPANKFDNWVDPINRTISDTPRLEMCPGTLFMLKVVNVLEKDYPFVDNIKPITALARLLWSERKWKFVGVAWLLTKFLSKYPRATMNVGTSDPGKFYSTLQQVAQVDKGMRDQIRGIAEKVYGAPQSDQDIARLLFSEDSLFDFMMDVLRDSGLEELQKIEMRAGGTLSADGEAGTLSIFQAGKMDEMEHLRKVAEKRFFENERCEIVVMGHTHQPESVPITGRWYYNTGSWTRYADISQQQNLTLDKLKDESKFPYKLIYVWVEEADDGSLTSESRIFEEVPSKPF